MRGTHRYGRILSLLVLFFGLVLARIVGSASQPAELGAVRWARSLEKALEESGASGRPVFALFQEVPGCQTCVSFGEQVLSHPLLVEAIEDEFVPLAIYNNRGGSDRAALERFGEPSWNNPVVRFLDGRGTDLLARRQAVWSPSEIADRMVDALVSAGRPVPAYLREASYELRARAPGRAVLVTHCYWEGEGCVGGLPGVLTTQAASLGGREVVVVSFDREVTGYETLLRAVREAGCADSAIAADAEQRAWAERVFGGKAQVSASRPRAASREDQKRDLRHSALADLALSDLQALRVNAALWGGRDPLRWLTPRQRARLLAQ